MIYVCILFHVYIFICNRYCSPRVSTYPSLNFARLTKNPKSLSTTDQIDSFIYTYIYIYIDIVNILGISFSMILNLLV